MNRFQFYRSLWLAASIVAFVAGCGSSGPKRYAVSGNATYDGKPIPVGQISFEPDTTKGNDGPGSTAIIKDGKYQTAADGGVVGGPYIVWISGFDGIMPPGGDTPDGTPLFNERYQAKVDLPRESSTQDFHVPSGGK